MRNDIRDDFDDVPSLSARTRDDDDFAPSKGARERTTVYSRTTPVVKVKGPSTGPLWALVGALSIALAGLGWWSFQQISLMEQQLVATQESFARISEEAAGRIQAITGKVVATESTANSGSEALKLQIRQLESKLLEQSKQQQGVVGQQSGLDKRLEQILAKAAEQQAANAQLRSEQQAANAQLQSELKSLSGELSALKAAQADQGKVDAELKSLSADISALKKQGDPSAAIDRLEQDLLVLKSEQENRPAVASSSGPNTAEFDAFRGQVTRNISTLQTQIQNLQRQLNARP
ncbi:ATPase [Pseudomonas sp. LS1212]|uniref:ATPase n=1 Tax=Pseudomonas sp. LS1212 TaxID=2972478 RepID=UPI00215CE1A3|nr:ATPase [Pseudomonas sp. LS1212]UVJ43196.1 ATPase [Pseudomonas sp. LS1212]